MPIPRATVATTEQLTPIGPTAFHTEASSIGLEPGFWPDSVIVTGIAERSTEFLKGSGGYVRSELVYMDYETIDERMYLRVWND